MSKSIAERIEALEGPCREMDWEVFCIHQPDRLKYYEESLARTKAEAEQYGTWNMRMDEIIQSERNLYAPRYTASLDAAMTLVPEGMMFTVSLHDHGQGAASIFKRDANGSRETACKLCVASTPALALCAAALRAQEATNG